MNLADRSRRERRRPTSMLLEPLEGRELLSVAGASKPSAARSAEVSPPARANHPWALFAHQPAAKGAHGRASRIDLRARDVIVSPTATAPPPTAASPAELSEAYGFDNVPQQGAGLTIAIVDGYDNPSIASDLATFSAQYNLPQMDGQNGDPTFTKATPQGQPAANSFYGLEISLDVEWAHAMAPKANILLVEALDRSNADLYAGPQSAEVYAIRQPGVVVVSNSFGAPEYQGEAASDPNFLAPAGHAPVAVTFSTGDLGAPGQYPAYSPNVVAVGGTTLTTTPNGTYLGETGWSGGGGGVSKYEPKPGFQDDLGYPARTIPDVSSEADPKAGVGFYDTFGLNGWLQIGGTSLSSPTWAALIARGDEARIASGLAPLDSADVNARLYDAYDSPAYLAGFHDVTDGGNGLPARLGYDLATGIGSPRAPQVVGLLASATDPSPTDPTADRLPTRR